MRYALAAPLLLAAPLFLAACVEEAAPAPDTCGAEGMQRLVGQSQDVLATMTFLQGTLRVIPPGAPVTRDYRPDRLNLDVDAKGIITRVWCG